MTVYIDADACPVTRIAENFECMIDETERNG